MKDPALVKTPWRVAVLWPAQHVGRLEVPRGIWGRGGCAQKTNPLVLWACLRNKELLPTAGPSDLMFVPFRSQQGPGTGLGAAFEGCGLFLPVPWATVSVPGSSLSCCSLLADQEASGPLFVSLLNMFGSSLASN